MVNTKSGCIEYDRTMVEINFPRGYVCCKLCPLLETYARLQCRRTGEYLLDDKGTGARCPLQIEEAK